MLLPAGWAVGLPQRIVPLHLPAEFDAICRCWCAARGGDTRTRAELGVAPRELPATLVQAVGWLVRQGHVARGQAGQLAAACPCGVDAPCGQGAGG